MSVRATLAALAFVAGCATVQAPNGGAPDTTPPHLLEVEPPARTTFFDEDRIVFTFDEFLKPGLEASDVFISPRPTAPYEAYVVNKRLIVKLPTGDWAKPNQTYVVTLGTKIRDNSAGNRLSTSVQYAFSTGAVVDSFSVSGQVFDLLSGEPQPGVLVGLYPTDSLSDSTGFAGANPAYIALSDDKGVFSLSYLAGGRYLLLGFADTDNSYSWSSLAEQVALDDLDTLELSEANSRELRNLYTSQIDTTSPRLARYRELNSSNYRLFFSEGLRNGRFTYRDSSWSWADTNAAPFYRDTTSQLVVRLPAPLPTDTFALHITAQDSSGNTLDTLLRLPPPRTDLIDYLDVFAATATDSPYQLRYYLSDVVHPDTLTRYVTLADTAGTVRPTTLSLSGHVLTISLPDTLQKEYPYRLTFDTLLTSRSGFRPEQAKVYQVTVPDDRRLGRLLGEVTSEKPVRIDLLVNGKRVRQAKGPRFDFAYLEPGTYKLRVIEDVDGNGAWTPGTLFPTKRVPEPVVVYPDEFVVRGGWENEQVLVYPPANQ